MKLNLPRVELARTPTPLQSLSRLGEQLGVRFWMKREDMTGDIGLGGNKVRKLELLLAEALAQNATHLVTTGGPQSNHARATAAAAARVGLKSVLVLAGKDPGTRQGNLLLSQLFGAEIRFPGAITPEEQAEALGKVASELEEAGARPYVIPVGGSTPLGAFGSYESFREMAAQLEPDAWVCLATGSGGTHAGVALGADWLTPRVRVQAFSVWQSAERIETTTKAIILGCYEFLEAPGTVPALYIDDRYLAPRYGKPSPAGLEAIRMVAETEGILLDPIYTGKAMAGVIDYIRSGRIPPGSQVVFLHTGGAPALFA